MLDRTPIVPNVCRVNYVPRDPVNTYLLQLRALRGCLTWIEGILFTRSNAGRMHTLPIHLVFWNIQCSLYISLLPYLWVKFLHLSLPPPASSTTGRQSDICRTGAGQTEAGAPGLLQPWPHSLQPRHCVRSDPLPGKTAVNTAALDTWMSWYLPVRATELCGNQRTIFMNYQYGI